MSLRLAAIESLAAQLDASELDERALERVHAIAERMMELSDELLQGEIEHKIAPALAMHGLGDWAGLLVSGPTSDDEIH